MIEEIDRFDCYDDEGNRYTVIKRQRMNTFRPLNGLVQKVRGTIDFVLSDGTDLNSLDEIDQIFEVVVTGQKLTRA